MKKLFLLLILVFLSFYSSSLFGQVPPAPGDGGGGSTDPFAEIPIDGGVGWLAAAGVAYGVKKWRDTKKDENKKQEL